jgi:hypothetical protein
MKLSLGLNLLNSRNVETNISKKILLANTDNKLINKEAQEKSLSVPSDPLYLADSLHNNMVFNPDIRYRATFTFSPLTGINYRNDLLIFAENNEIKKVVGIMANEICVLDTEANKYPVSPKINVTQVDKDKQKVAESIQEYLDKVFYPKLYQFFNFKNDGILKIIQEFLVTGKLAYEIIYDNIKNPKEIIGIQPIDPATLQKFKFNNYIYYVQRPIYNNGLERILNENQLILIEWNEYDFGYISYVDKLRRSFNIMRSMQTSKILWFAAKSQVRVHINLGMGDIARPDAINKLVAAKNQYTLDYTCEDDGVVRLNGKPNNSGYREFFTAETASSGKPDIDEVIGNGPDLTEVDSLQYWEKLFYKDTEIPYDRVDPNSADIWGFNDVASLRKIEINFAKLISAIRKILNELFIKPINIQLTLKEVEIGIDLNLLDAIKMEWVAFNHYEKLAELEVLGKKLEIAGTIAAFGEAETASGSVLRTIPLRWIILNYLDFTPDQLKSMEIERKKEYVALGYREDGSNPIAEAQMGMGEEQEGYEDEDNEYNDNQPPPQQGRRPF